MVSLSSFTVQLPLILVGYVFLLYFQQDHMVYRPSRYSEPLGEVPDFELTPLNFPTEHGEQGAFVMRSSEHCTTVRRIYFVFGGNAMVARNWIKILQRMPKAVLRDTAFVLLDYPGFGESQGAPSTASILSSAKEAVKWAMQDLAANQDLESESPSLEEDVKLGAIGHSIGCAVALHLAVEQLSEFNQLQHLVLSAPFTTLAAMAKVLIPVMKPLPDSVITAMTSRHTWNNLEAVAQLAGGSAPRVDIIHGTSDEIVPYEHGQQIYELLTRLSFNATFTDADAGHNDLLAKKEYQKWMKTTFS